VSAASARVRVANYVPFLSRHGVDLEFTPTLSSEDYALLVSSAGVARKAGALTSSVLRAATLRNRSALFLVHRLLLMTPVPFVDPPRHVDVYDFDDALTVGSAADANKRFQWTKQEGRRAIACMSRAQLVIAANPTLAAQAREHAKRVEVVPSCVNPDRQPLATHPGGEQFRIGWIGSHTTVPYLRPLLPVIERLHERGLPVTLTVIGGDTGLRASWIEHKPWSVATEAAELARLDAGVMPLPDSDWTRGKSGFKLLQYFAAGVPGVASPVGVNAELIADGRGLAAHSDAEWEHALVELQSDAEARRQRGLAARRYVEQHYSYQRWAPELARMLRELRA
jgi:hypothetical protein